MPAYIVCKKRLVCMILTLASTVSIGYFCGIRYGTSQYGLLVLFFVFPVLYKVYMDTVGTEEKRTFLFCGALGLFYAVTLWMGSLSENGDITASSLKRSCIFALVLIFTFTYMVVWIFRRIESLQIKYATSGNNLDNYRKANIRAKAKGNFFLVWAIIFVCWLPLFILFLPGTFNYDVPVQLMYFFTGEYSAHHPLLHTLYLGSCIQIGLSLFATTTAGAVIYSLSQMLLMSAIFSYVSTSLLKNFRIPDLAYRILILFFAVYPVNSLYSFTATKDVLFTGFFLLTIILLLEALCISPPPFWIKRWWKFILSAACMMLLRNNAFYAFLAFFVIILLIKAGMKISKNRKRIQLPCWKAFLASIMLYLCISNGLTMATGATSPSLAEMLSVPLQQIARAVNDNSDEITEEELDAIYEILTEEGIENYDPTISDPVKGTFDEEAFMSDPMKYVKVYLSIGRKAPFTYLNAFTELTCGYWYPYTNYTRGLFSFGVRTDRYEWTDEGFIIQSIRLFPGISDKLSDFFKNKLVKIPVVGLFFNMGLICWIYFGLMTYMVYTKSKFTIPFLLVLCLWLTCLLGPVVVVRYLYPLIACVPPIIALLFGKTEEYLPS